MAARTTPLTDTQIKQAKPDSKKVVKLADGDGFQLLMKPSGSKIWHMRYTNPITKNKTTLSFGSYPSVSLANSRSKRKEARELLAQNLDPKKHREEAQIKRFALNNSLKSVFDEWLTDWEQQSISKRID